MFSEPLLLSCALLALSSITAAETVLGAYIFSRHGDRTSKSTPPTLLTDLGYQQIYTSGDYYRNRYIASNASSQIFGISPDLVDLAQIAASAPLDNVIMAAIQGFLQGLYPAVGPALGSTTLRNGTMVQSPLNGYQLIPVAQIASATGSENSAWLQGSTGCANAVTSSNQYFYSTEYNNLLNSTMAFYQGLAPMVVDTFGAKNVTFKNAYKVYDLLNVASIHNATFPSSELLTPDTFFQLTTLAATHEYNLAYNASSPIRAMAGSTLAAQMLQALNQTITTPSAPKLSIQFGAYGSFQSFFGLAQLPAANPDFTGLPDYASSMALELVTNASTSPFPSPTDISVRFLFLNGTASVTSRPTPYALFGQPDTLISWSAFVTGIQKFQIGSQRDWCTACGNSTGVCSFASSTTDACAATGSDTGAPGSVEGLPTPIVGIIGAMVTLVAVLVLQALVFVVGGWRLEKKKPKKAVEKKEGDAWLAVGRQVGTSGSATT